MKTLKDYAAVEPGHSFRGSIPEVADGSTLTIQMRDVGMGHGVAWAGAARTNPGGRKQPNLLRQGDILFLARGLHNFAVYLDQVPARAVCTQSFFLVRMRRSTTRLLPDFLAWQINQVPAQCYLRKNAEGTDQMSIRRAILEALPIIAPPLEEQRKVLDFAAKVHSERQHLEQMIRNRERQMQGIASQVLSSKRTKPSDPFIHKIISE